MRWRISISNPAATSLAKLSERRAEMVMEEIRAIPDNPSRIEKLKGKRAYKLKFVEPGWSFRVLYTVRRGLRGGTIRVYKAVERGPNTY